MNGIKELYRHKRFYWVCVVITAVLSYGFTLTNHAITADDEAFDLFFGEGLVLAEGRWGYVPIQRIFNSYLFLPFWRSFIAVILMVAGITLLCGIFRKYSRGKFDDMAATIFACVAISFPLTAYLFSFMLANLELGLSLVLVGCSLLFFAGWALDKGAHRYGVFSALILGYAIAFRETAIVFFMISGFSLLLLAFIYGSDQKINRIKPAIIVILKMFGVLIGAVVTWFVGAQVFQRLLSIPPVDYTTGMLQHDTSNIFRFIGSMVRFALTLPVALISAATNITSLLILGISGVLIVVGVIYGLKVKRVSIFIVSLLLVIFSYSMFIFTGWSYMYLRMRTPFMLLVGFGIALGYIISTQIQWKRVKVKYLMIFVSIWLVFYGSRMMNQVFYLDYLGYKKDVFVMETVIQDLGGLQQEYPILFVGLLPQQLPLDEVAGYSIFNLGRRGTWYSELDVRRAYRFFTMHGFPIEHPEEVDKDQLLTYIADMESWPADGYIRQTEHYVIVKLGPSSLEQFIPQDGDGMEMTDEEYQ